MSTGSTRKRILFLAERCTLAHVIRPLMLAKSLDPSRYEIHFACDKTGLMEGKEFIFEGTNFHHWNLKSMPSATFLERADKGKPLFDIATLSTYVRDDLQLIENVRPDFIIGDMRWSLTTSAEYRHIPYAIISNIHWNTQAQPFLFPLPEFKSYHLATRLLGEERVFALADRFIKPGALRAHARSINQLRADYGLPLYDNILEALNAGQHMLYADMPEMIAAPGLSPAHHYLGPITWLPQVKKPEWWSRIPENKPTVYVALGSSGHAELLPEIIAQLKRHDVTVIAAAPEKFSDDRVFAAPFFPWGEAAKRSVLMIGNGGSGAVYQAIEAGVPLLGIVANQDQVITMAHCEQQGFGLMLRSSQASGKNLNAAITQLLNEAHYRLRAQELQRVMATYDYRETFPQIMEQLLADASNSTS